MKRIAESLLLASIGLCMETRVARITKAATSATKVTHLVRLTQTQETRVQVVEDLHHVLMMPLRLAKIRDNLRLLILLPS